ncbi:GGDEF domain-containing protein [Endothiovibrio diazotrophicus]
MTPPDDTNTFADLAMSEEAIGQLLLFRGADLNAILGLLNHCPVREVAAETLLITPGVEHQEVYVLLRGSLRVHLDEKDAPCLTVLQVGECAGEMSALEQKSASAFVIANEPCLLLVLPQDVLWSLINNSHAVARNLLYLLSGRLRSGNVTIAVSQELQQIYEQYAKVDSLTGLHNRRWIDEVLPRLVSRCHQSGHILSVLMVDVDHFKRFNDTHGHQAGDQALRALGQTLTRHLRPNDVAARYGGEEFLVVLADTGAEEAFGVAERLREAVEQQPLRCADDSPLPSITISLGLSQLAPDQDSETLIADADAALYRAKHAGRNRVSA